MLKKNLLFLFLALSHLHADFYMDGDNNKIVTTTKRIILEDYPDSFNPSLIKFGEGFLLTFRYSPSRFDETWISYIGVVLLDKSMELASVPQLLDTRLNNSIPSQSEDARIFSYRGRLFLIYNDNPDMAAPSIWDRRDMYMAELFYKEGQFSLSTPLKLFHEGKYHGTIWQKNWVPFEWNRTLLISYMINPHEILYPNLKSGECYFAYETQSPLSWDFGTMRLSTPPLLVDGEYLAFFHSGLRTTSPVSGGWSLWHYFMGAYTFSAEPPFQITKMSITPIIGEDFYTYSNAPKRVVFPGGYVISGSIIYMAYGKDDSEIWIATLDKEALMNSLIPVGN